MIALATEASTPIAHHSNTLTNIHYSFTSFAKSSTQSHSTSLGHHRSTLDTVIQQTSSLESVMSHKDHGYDQNPSSEFRPHEDLTGCPIDYSSINHNKMAYWRSTAAASNFSETCSTDVSAENDTLTANETLTQSLNGHFRAVGETAFQPKNTNFPEYGSYDNSYWYSCGYMSHCAAYNGTQALGQPQVHNLHLIRADNNNNNNTSSRAGGGGSARFECDNSQLCQQNSAPNQPNLQLAMPTQYPVHSSTSTSSICLNTSRLNGEQFTDTAAANDYRSPAETCARTNNRTLRPACARTNQQRKPNGSSNFPTSSSTPVGQPSTTQQPPQECKSHSSAEDGTSSSQSSDPSQRTHLPVHTLSLCELYQENNNKKQFWSDAETQCLLDIFRRPEIQLAMGRLSKRHSTWQLTAKHMLQRGYQRNARQCRQKLTQLLGAEVTDQRRQAARHANVQLPAYSHYYQRHLSASAGSPRPAPPPAAAASARQKTHPAGILRARATQTQPADVAVPGADKHVQWQNVQIHIENGGELPTRIDLTIPLYHLHPESEY